MNLTSQIKYDTPTANTVSKPVALSCDSLSISESILRQFGPRAITMLTAPRQAQDGSTFLPRLSANDAYAALQEACKKMARVTAARIAKDGLLSLMSLADAIRAAFPEPAAYLARCIRSVISDAERLSRHEPITLSLDAPLRRTVEGNSFTLAEYLPETDFEKQPETAFLDASDRSQFRSALSIAIRKFQSFDSKVAF